MGVRSYSTISFSISSFCLLLDLVTTYVLDFPKISITNRASAVMFATNPTVKDVKFAFYYENNVLKRKWESKDGYKRGNQILISLLSST
jgi:hypothetical protein